MNWWNYLEQLRREPEEKRRLILWWTTSLISLLILAGWLLSWRLTDSPVGPNQESAVATGTEAATTSSGWSDFKLRMIKGWQTLTKTK